MFMQNKRALTLVELIVVVTIVAILWTISFLSYASYTSSSRDAVRGTDITNINRVLSLHKTAKLRYPKASDAIEVAYSGAVLWEQWVFWLETKAELWKIFGELADPLHGNKYTYSVTSNKKEYQVWAVFETADARPNDVSIRALQSLNLPSVVATTYAADPFDPLELSPKIWLDATDVDGDGDTWDNPSNGSTSLWAWVNKSSAWSANNPSFTDGNIWYHSSWLDGAYPGVFIRNGEGVILTNSDITQGDIFYVVQNEDPFGGTDTNGLALQSTLSNKYGIWYWGTRRDALRINNSPKFHNKAPSYTSNRTAVYIYGFHTNNTNYSFYRTGNEVDQWATSSITGHVWAFNKWWANTAKADWMVSEILIFDTQLSSDDREKVEWYLAHKWGQQSDLPGSHPYKLAPPETEGPPPTPDSDPDSFSFSVVTNADLSTPYISNTINVTGINTPAVISISGSWAEYSINNTAYISTNSTVTLNDTVSLRLTSSSSNSTLTQATLTIDSVSENYDVTTLLADITPDNFSFNAIIDADVATSYTSNTITVSGLNTSANISITGVWAEYRISDGIPFDATESGTASASSTYSSNSPAEAFDNNTSSNGWWNNGSLPAQLNYDFGSWADQLITRYTLYRDSAQDWGWSSWKYSPSNWTFQWSDDNSTWTTLDTRTNESISADSTKKQYSFINTNYYRYYRINISAADHSGTDWVNITEMELINELWSGEFTSDPGSVVNGDIVSVTMPSSSTAGTLKTAQLTVGTETWDYNITTVAPDTTPDNFSFSDESNASLSTLYTSNSITVSGINAPTAISISWTGLYRINGASYTGALGSIDNGDVINIQQTSSSSNSVTVSSTLNIGWVVAAYNVTTPAPAPDTTPDAFSFTAQPWALLGSQYISNTITVSGINASATMSISGTSWEYDINDLNSYNDATTTVENGDTIALRANASLTPWETRSITLTIWWVPADYDIIAIGPDTTPDPYVLWYVTEALLNSTYESNPIIVSWINTATPIDIDGGAWKYKINGWPWLSGPSVVYNWDEVIVKLQSLASWNTNVSTTLDIGGVTRVFDITTLLDDTTPDSFVFTPVTNANLNTTYISDTVTITGINAPATISVSSGNYRIGAIWDFTNVAGTIENNESVTLQTTSAIVWSTPTSITLTIGWVSGTYTVTTQPFTPPSGPTIDIPQSNTYVSWEYNGLIAHAQSGAIHYIIAAPSIMTYDSSDTDIVSIIANRKLVYNGFENIPASYSWSSLTLSGWFDFNITSPLLYEWSREDLWSYGWLKQVDEGIRSTYNNFPYYKNVAEYLDDYSLNYLESIVGNIIGINPIKPFYCSDILQSNLVYNVAPIATVTASPSWFGSVWVTGINNGVKSTQWATDYEYHSADANATIEFEWEDQQQIWYVRIYNRTGCCSDRLTGATIKLYNEAGGLLYSHPLWDTSGDYVIDLDLEGIGHLHFVKKLTIESVGWNYLNVREVELFLWGWLKSGIYKVDKDGLGGQSPYNVYCDMETDGGGWTRIGENYIDNGDFKNQFHVDQHSFPYWVGASTNVIVSHATQAPPLSLPDAFVLRHTDGWWTRAYPLEFDTIPGEFFAQEIRLSAWVQWTTGSIFSNTITYDDASVVTTTPEYIVLETDGDWEYQIARIPLSWLVDDFSWDIADGLAGTIYFTGLEMEVYYQ